MRKICWSMYLTNIFALNNFSFRLFNISRELISGTIFFQLFIGILHMSATYFEMELVSNFLDLRAFLTYPIIIICSVSRWSWRPISKYFWFHWLFFWAPALFSFIATWAHLQPINFYFTPTYRTDPCGTNFLLNYKNTAY